MLSFNIVPVWSEIYGAMSKGVDTITCNKDQSLLWDPNDICAADDWQFTETSCENAMRQIHHAWIEPKTCRLGLPLPGDESVSCSNIVSRGLMAFTFIGWILVLTVTGFILVYKEHTVIVRTLSVPQGVILLGIFLQFSSPWLEGNLENNKMCLAAPIMNLVAGYLILGGLAHATHQAKKPLIFISNFKYVQTHLSAGVLVGFYLLAWCSSDPPTAGFIKKHFQHGTFSKFHACVTSRTYHIVASTLLSISSLFMTYVSFSARNQEGSLKSALHTFYANISFLVRTLLRFYIDQASYGEGFDPQSKYVLDSLIDFFFISFVLMSYWFPRIQYITNGTMDHSADKSFIQQLDDPVSRHFITKLAESLTSEISRQVYFYGDVMTFKNMCRQKKNTGQIKAKANEIFNLYIKEGAPKAVETTELLRERCEKLLKFEKDKSVVFDQNLNDIRTSLNQQLSRKFMASSFLDNSSNVSRWCDTFIRTYDPTLKRAVLEKFTEWLPKKTGEIKVTKVNEMKERRRMQEEALVHMLRVKLLVLGASNSGKSTFCRILENPEVDGEVLSDRMLRTVKSTLRDNVVDAVLRLINGVELEKKAKKEVLDDNLKVIKSKFVQSRVIGSNLSPELAEIACNILSLPYVQYAISAGNIYVQQKSEYYLVNAERFADKDYQPNRTDLAYMYLESVIDTYELSRFENMLNEEVTYVLTDMVGTKSLRYKWKTEYEGSKAVVFCVNLSGIGRRSEENPRITELEESLQLFQMVIHDEYFADMPIFLVFTKKDAYDYWAALDERSIEDVRAVFPDYDNPTGVPNDTIDPLQVQEFVEQVFVCEAPNPENVTPLYVTATNERSVHQVFDRIRQNVMSTNATKMAPRIKQLRDAIVSGFVSDELDM
jgi:GTPase SAR1 family protein